MATDKAFFERTMIGKLELFLTPTVVLIVVTLLIAKQIMLVNQSISLVRTSRVYCVKLSRVV